MIFQLWDLIEYMCILLPNKKYAYESHYWRFTAIYLILLLILNCFISSYIHTDLSLFISIILGIYLFFHILIRLIYVNAENNDDQ